MNKKIKILLSIIISLFVMILTNEVYAASANLSAKDTNLEPGQSTSIIVSVSATEAWNLKLSSNGGNLSGNLASADAMGSEVSQTVITANFSSSSEGSYVITLSGQITGSDLIKQTVSKSITINVKAKEPVIIPDPIPDPEPDPVPEQKPDPAPGQKDPDSTTRSSVAILSDLGIRPKEYDFSGFSKNRNEEEWHVTVPNEVTRIEVYATAGENGKVISGTGWKNLKDIRTPLEVVVQSEDGTKTKTYTIYVTREVEEAETDTDTDEEVSDTTGDEIAVGLGKLEIAGMTLSPEFNTDEYKYTVEGIIDDIKTLSDFKELITAEANFEGASIEVTSDDEEFKVGRNKIIITVKDTDGREIAIYNIVLKLKSSDTAAGIIKDDEEDETKSNVDTNKIIVIAAISIVSIFAIVITAIAYKQRKLLEDSGLVGRNDDYEEFDWGVNTEENKEDIKEKLDEFLNDKTSESEVEDADFETKKGRGGKRFQ